MAAGATRQPNPCKELRAFRQPKTAAAVSTRLTGVSFKAKLPVTHASDSCAIGVIAKGLQLGVDHELLCDVAISIAGRIDGDRFQDHARGDLGNVIDSRIKYLPNRFGTLTRFHRCTEISRPKRPVGFNATTTRF